MELLPKFVSSQLQAHLSEENERKFNDLYGRLTFGLKDKFDSISGSVSVEIVLTDLFNEEDNLGVKMKIEHKAGDFHLSRLELFDINLFLANLALKDFPDAKI